MFNGKFSVELFLIFNSSFLDRVLRFFFLMSVDISLINRLEYVFLLFSIVWFISCNINYYKIIYMYDFAICK